MIINKMASNVDPDEMAHYTISSGSTLHRYLYWSTGLKWLSNLLPKKIRLDISCELFVMNAYEIMSLISIEKILRMQSDPATHLCMPRETSPLHTSNCCPISRQLPAIVY